jgi:hypothetical protein
MKHPTSDRLSAKALRGINPLAHKREPGTTTVLALAIRRLAEGEKPPRPARNVSGHLMVFDPLPAVIPALPPKDPHSLLFLVAMLVLVLWLTVTLSLWADRTGRQQTLGQVLAHERHWLLGLLPSSR